MFGRRDYTKEYDARNPMCAAVFHPMVDELSQRVGGNSSASFFKERDVRDQLDKHYENGKRAVQTLGDAKACENLHMQIVLGTQSLQQRVESIDPALYGMVVTIPTIRDVVFGTGPGFAAALRADPYQVTLRSCYIIAQLLESCEQTTIVVGARSLWSSFHEGCLHFYGRE